MHKIEHIGIAVKNIESANAVYKKLLGYEHYKTEEVEIERLKKEDFIVLNEQPKQGADNKLVAFLHPRSTNGVLVELCQEINNNKK